MVPLDAGEVEEGLALFRRYTGLSGVRFAPAGRYAAKSYGVGPSLQSVPSSLAMKMLTA